MLVKNVLVSDDVISIIGEYVPAVICMVLSWLNDMYRGSAANVIMGAELPAIEDAANIDFLFVGVMKPIIWLIYTEPADFGVGNDGNYIANAVLTTSGAVK